VSIHSEAAALLLVWAANLIKLYACTKRLGILEITASSITGPGGSLNLDEIQRIQARTKIMVRRELEGKRQQEREEEALRAEQVNEQPVGRSALSTNKNIGHFLQNKQMIYKAEENAILPLTDDTQPPQMIDISVLKRGGFNQFSTKSKAA